MPFQYNISKAIEIGDEVNAFDQRVIVLRFKYVDFKLTLDDEGKEQELIKLLTGKYAEREGSGGSVEMPKFYKDGGDEET